MGTPETVEEPWDSGPVPCQSPESDYCIMSEIRGPPCTVKDVAETVTRGVPKGGVRSPRHPMG